MKSINQDSSLLIHISWIFPRWTFAQHFPFAQQINQTQNSVSFCNPFALQITKQFKRRRSNPITKASQNKKAIRCDDVINPLQFSFALCFLTQHKIKQKQEKIFVNTAQ